MAELAARRQGTHSTKTRGMVARRRGEAVAPERHRPRPRRHRRARRSGRAAAWSSGPSPRHYIVKVNRKARRAALRSALSIHAERETLHIARRARVRRRPRPPRRPSCCTPTAAAPCWWCSATTSWSPPSRSATSRACTSCTSTTSASPTSSARRRWSLSQAALDKLTARAKKDKRGAAGDERARRSLMDHSQVIIRPVVSEKSYVLATADKYTFRVHDKAHKTQIKQAVEALFDVHVVEVRTSKVPSKPKRRGVTAGRTRAWKKAVVQVRPGRHHPDLPGPRGATSKPCRFASPSQPPPDAGSSRSADFAEITKTEPERTPRRGSEEVRRAQRARPQDRRAIAAAAPSASTARSTSSAPRTACRPRSPRSSTTRTARRTSRCCTTSTARRPTSSPRTACGSA